MNDLNNGKEQLLQHIRQRILQEFPETNNFEVPEKLSRNLKTYMSMFNDMNHCIRLLKVLKDQIAPFPRIAEQVVLKAYFHSMIITYSKCFMDASKSKQAKLEIDHLLRNSRVELLNMHEEIMEIRNFYIAHRGDNLHDQSIVFFSNPSNIEDDSVSYNIKSSRVNNFGLDKLMICDELFESIFKALGEKLYLQIEKVHNHILKNYTSEQINEWLIK